MLVASFTLSILIQAALPIFITYLFVRHYKTEWRLAMIGLLAYLIYQVVQAPIFEGLSGTEFYQNQLAALPSVHLALIVGLLSAVLEQGIRLGSFWYARKSLEGVGHGLTISAGHGGSESVLIGIQFLINFAFAISITTSGVQSLNLSEAEAAQLQSQVTAFWALPWYLPLAAALQRLAVLALQFALGTMVWLAVSRRAWIWLAASVLWHTALNALLVVLSASMPDLANTGVFALVGLVNLGVTYWLVKKADALPVVMPPAVAS